MKNKMMKRQKKKKFFYNNLSRINRKGAEKIMSIYWFAIIFIVAAAIVYLAYSFYGKPYDIREIEVGLLSDRVADCLNHAGYIKDNWPGLNEENFFTECGLNFNVEDTRGWEDDQYYVMVRISDFNSDAELNLISAGNENLRLNCATEGRNLPVCLERKMYSIDKANAQYEIEMLSIVRKTEKNVQ